MGLKALPLCWYGIAVTGTMMIDTILVGFVIILAWRWNRWLAGALLTALLLVDLGQGFFRVFLRYGFMEHPDIPKGLAICAEQGLVISLQETSFFLSREVVIPKLTPGMALWREVLFSWMLRNAQNATEFFRIPTNLVVELGTQVEI